VGGPSRRNIVLPESHGFEIVNLTAAVLMAAAFVPYGIEIMSNKAGDRRAGAP
jgi:hypothetical protein